MFALPLEAKTLKGEVKYTVKQAREEAFSNVEYTLPQSPQSIIKANLTDPNYKENQKAIKYNNVDLNDRHITLYANGDYTIIYKNNLYYEYYYNSQGKLNLIGKRTGLVYPTQSYKYNVSGKLEEVNFYISQDICYIFSANGKFLAKWLGNQGYDSNGNLLPEELN